ncbi:fused response regulator/phosphatase [Methylomonas koyamae]|uniref:fused response regulator/phosphatase n=1 Tax=Methylomonas koyamae TaxID=702114 RepID=UPI001C33DD36|nr:fused response regulator/phosphatase [Methylomonas koyamae]BBL59658.1 fused response regulator/phosphatase [Methylomonas koyamae]
MQTAIVFFRDAGADAEADNLQRLLAGQGYTCWPATSVEEALALVEGRPADLLIASCRDWPWRKMAELREAADSYLPIVRISESISDTVLEQCAAADVDTVLFRPVHFGLLLFKIRSSLRLRELYRREREQKNQLLGYWQAADLEHEVAAKLFNNVLKADFLETEAVAVSMSPMALFNGDLVLVAKTPEDHLHLLLGDFTGHGLAASIATPPLADMFYGMSRKGFDVEDIAAEINAKLYRLLPANRFLAATLVALYPEGSTLKTIACGLPDHYLVNRIDKSYRTITSNNIPLGIQPAIRPNPQLHRVGEHESLYLLTDGVFEAENALGELFGAERVLQAILQNPAGDFELLQSRLAEHTGGGLRKDDNTMAILHCAVDSAPWRSSRDRAAGNRLAAMAWKQMMEFDIDSLRSSNPVPLLVNTLLELQCLQAHRQAIFMIVNELFSNALDHGLLQLDSADKDSPEGFLRFYELKQQRLQTQAHGKIRLLFAHQPTAAGGRLTIKVADSGSGFDWRRCRTELQHNFGYSGRGIALLEKLCSSVTYHGCGNRVTAVFDWQA